jgi:hypothetical protein
LFTYLWDTTLVICIILVILNTEVCSKDKAVKSRNDAAKAHEILEAPFHFLLALPDYTPDRLDHDSDIFSTWGELQLTSKHNRAHTRESVREELVRAAKLAGWRSAGEIPEIQAPDLAKYGIKQQYQDIAITKKAASPGQNPPTRYGCRIWISDDGRVILVAYRVDGE